MVHSPAILPIPDNKNCFGMLLHKSWRCRSFLRKRKKIVWRDLTRTVRKSDYTTASALSKHMASIFNEKSRKKEKGVLNRRKPVLNPYNKSLLIYIPNIYPMIRIVFVILYIQYELSVTYLRQKNVERKKRKIYGRIYRRKLILNQGMQKGNVNLYMKY